MLEIDLPAFLARLRGSRHTLKRTLTDQRIFAGIGNAYSDEILLYAGLSPFKRARDVSDAEGERLFETCRKTLTEWVAILRRKAGDAFPDKVTAFHDEMAAHGKYRAAVPGVRRADPAHRARGEREQLLRTVPDRGPGAGRPVALTAPEGHLAEADRGTRGALEWSSAQRPLNTASRRSTNDIMPSRASSEPAVRSRMRGTSSKAARSPCCR